MPTPIPLICDRCRAEGAAGEDPFAHYAELLEFEPVPRRPRADGWDGEVQRAFIAVLAATGSPRQAAAAVGKAQFGVEQLKKAKGNESFMAAWERAMAFFAENRSQRLAEGVRAATAAMPRPPRPAWGHAATRREPIPPRDFSGRGTGRRLVEGSQAAANDDDQDDEQTHLELLEVIVHKYLLKLGAERRVRLEGRIAEADFYLRQVTMLEVALDVMSSDGMALLRDARLGGFDLLHLAETEMSKLLDEARREHWEACGDPPRPEYPPRYLLEQHEAFATEPLPLGPGLQPGHEDRRRKQEEQYAQGAQAQILWEAEARADFERRQSQGSPDPACPGPRSRDPGSSISRP